LRVRPRREYRPEPEGAAGHSRRRGGKEGAVGAWGGWSRGGSLYQQTHVWVNRIVAERTTTATILSGEKLRGRSSFLVDRGFRADSHGVAVLPSSLSNLEESEGVPPIAILYVAGVSLSTPRKFGRGAGQGAEFRGKIAERVGQASQEQQGRHPRGG